MRRLSIELGTVIGVLLCAGACNGDKGPGKIDVNKPAGVAAKKLPPPKADDKISASKKPEQATDAEVKGAMKR